MKMELDDEFRAIIGEFINETEELLEKVDKGLLELEKSTEDKELLNSIFRTFHTIKGNSMALGFEKLEKVAHKTEDIFKKIREGELKATPKMTDVVLEAVDSIKLLVEDLKNGIESSLDITGTIERLGLAATGKLEDIPAKGQVDVVPAIETAKETPDKEETTGPKKKPSPPATKPSQVKISEGTIRVDIRKLNSLLNITGELVLKKNNLLNVSTQEGLKNSEKDGTEKLNEITAKFGLLVSDLHEKVISTRMQPIGRIFTRYSRIVRDLSSMLKKEIELSISGEHTELDNTIIEEIGDPLMHMVRNCCDHGLETPEERKAQGKSSRGKINLSAYYESSFVVIEIKDDGRGIDPERIKKKALETGTVTQKDIEKMEKRELFNLLFLPGFSTAEKVTAVSGRGVGLDVVRESILKMNGIVELDSELGKGSVFKVKFPLTLSIITGLEVEIGTQRYLLPQESITNIIRVSPKDLLKKRVETGDEKKIEHTVSFKPDRTLPIINLKDTLKEEEEEEEGRENFIVVIKEGETRVGILVNNVLKQQEVVVKPLGKYVQKISPPEVRGASVMGNGKVELILNDNHFLALSR